MSTEIGRMKTGIRPLHWLYVMKKSLVDEYIGSKSKCITFSDVPTDIVKYDILILFQKDRKESGFAGFVQVNTDPKDVDDVSDDDDTKKINTKIFNDDRYNRSFCKLRYKNLFHQIVPPSELLTVFGDDIPHDLADHKKFASEYLSDDNCVVEFNDIGKAIVRKLANIVSKRSSSGQCDSLDNEKIASSKKIKAIRGAVPIEPGNGDEKIASGKKITSTKAVKGAV